MEPEILSMIKKKTETSQIAVDVLGSCDNCYKDGDPCECYSEPCDCDRSGCYDVKK